MKITGERILKGDKKVIEQLNEALYLELGAVNQYWLHYRLLEDWGYTLLAKKERAESIEEMQHADKLVARIIFLEGHPNLQTVAPLRIGQNVKEVLEADLAGEYDARKAYKKSRDICHDAGDYVTMKLFEELFTDEERADRTQHDKIFVARTPRADIERLSKAMADLGRLADELDEQGIYERLRAVLPEFSGQATSPSRDNVIALGAKV